MELELGLALPDHNPIKGFKVLPEHMLRCTSGCVRNKRGFKKAFGEFEEAAGVDSKTLPLLLWHGLPPNEEDDHKAHDRDFDSDAFIRNDEEDDVLVGWPPIQSSRKKMLNMHGGGGFVRNKRRARESSNNNIGASNNSMYIKVKMEGVAIARKIDMRLYHSFHTLKHTLISMFSNDQKCNRNSGSFTLTYQDKEGDWMLAADVPWKTFIESVQRLEIRRNWDGSG